MNKTNGLRQLLLRIRRGSGKTNVDKIYTYIQIKGKKSENSYQELKRSQKDRHTQTVSRYFDRHGRLLQSEESKCL